LGQPLANSAEKANIKKAATAARVFRQADAEAGVGADNPTAGVAQAGVGVY